MRTLSLPLWLAVISIAGIVGMLLFDGAGDAIAFLLTALPLIVGIGAIVWNRPGARRLREE
jgi:hypothetical protein